MTEKFPELEKDTMSLQTKEAHQVLGETNKNNIFNKKSISERSFQVIDFLFVCLFILTYGFNYPQRKYLI